MSETASDNTQPTRQFKGIWICAAIWEDDRLTLAERCLIAEVDSLTHPEKACYASNDFLANRFRLSAVHMNGMLSDLTRWRFLVRLAFTGRQTLRCVHPAFSSNPSTVNALLSKHGVRLPDAPPEKPTQASLGINPKAGRVGIKPKAALSQNPRQPSDKTQTEISKKEQRERTTKTGERAQAKAIPSAPEKNGVVVVSSLGPVEEEAAEKLAKVFGANPKQSQALRDHIRRNGLSYVQEKSEIALRRPPQHRNGAFWKALDENWPKPTEDEKPSKKKPEAEPAGWRELMQRLYPACEIDELYPRGWSDVLLDVTMRDEILAGLVATKPQDRPTKTPSVAPSVAPC
jgi:hypothetical protein